MFHSCLAGHEKMMLSVKPFIIPFLSMAIVGPSIGIQPLRADDQDLQVTLQRMERLLEQQQAELETQQSQKTLANKDEPSAVDLPSASQSVVLEEQKPATEIAL